MKRLIVSAILILSDLERKARREMFDPIRTIVNGANDTGKSSLIKSIYQAFGAEPAKINPRWKAAEVKTVIRFTIDGVGYQLLRDQSYFAMFDADGNFLKAFTRVSTELAPYLAQLSTSGLYLHHATRSLKYLRRRTYSCRFTWTRMQAGIILGALLTGSNNFQVGEIR